MNITIKELEAELAHKDWETHVWVSPVERNKDGAVIAGYITARKENHFLTVTLQERFALTETGFGPDEKMNLWACQSSIMAETADGEQLEILDEDGKPYKRCELKELGIGFNYEELFGLRSADICERFAAYFCSGEDKTNSLSSEEKALIDDWKQENDVFSVLRAEFDAPTTNQCDVNNRTESCIHIIYTTGDCPRICGAGELRGLM